MLTLVFFKVQGEASISNCISFGLSVCWYINGNFSSSLKMAKLSSEKDTNDIIFTKNLSECFSISLHRC